MTDESNVQVAYISRIGIQYKERSHIHFAINNIDFELNDKGIFQASNIRLTSFKFLEDVDKDAIIDFILQPVE